MAASETPAPEGEIWRQPAKGGYPDPAWLALPGLERMRAWRTGEVPTPPIVYLMEMGWGDVSAGHGSFTIPASPWFANLAGLIPGGLLATVADAALGTAIGSDLPPGVSFTTAELSMSFLRPVLPDPETKISAGGQLIQRGSSVGLTEAFMINETSGEMVAFASSRLSIFAPIEPLPEPPAKREPAGEPIPGASPDDPLQQPLRGESLPPETFERMSGLEVLRAVSAGELPSPPFFHLFGLRMVEAGEGNATMALPCSKWLSTAAGTVQGGFTAMLADAAITAAIYSTAPAGTAIATLDLKVNYLRPVFPDGNDLIARSTVLHRGRTLAIANAELTNAEGKKVAVATGSAMYLPGRPADLAGVELGGETGD
jgi:uncharacterized protein (TIGR00369 family)